MASELDLLLLHAKLANTVGENYEFRVGIAKVLDRSRWREELIGLLWAWSRHARVEATVRELMRTLATWAGVDATPPTPACGRPVLGRWLMSREEAAAWAE